MYLVIFSFVSGTWKTTGLAVDWIAHNLYWTEFDRSGTKQKGRVMVSKNDGRYRRSLVSGVLEAPTSVAVDPQYGRMFFADSGSTPKIEVAWMDGSRRRPLVVDNIRHPTGNFFIHFLPFCIFLKLIYCGICFSKLIF